MSKKMTPCERLGYKVGDKFEVIIHHAFKKGQVVTLHEDDGTECPLFAGDGGGAGVFYGVECSFATLNKQVRKIANKLKPAKQALADAIHQNGGWPESELLDFATSNAFGEVLCSASHPERKGSVWVNGDYYRLISCIKGTIANWHQTILSREEYYQSYPNVDADGWIEWNGGECPVDNDSLVDVKFPDGSEYFNTDAYWDWSSESDTPISHYRQSKKVVKPELCESVTRSIPEPESIDGLCAKVTEENKHQHIDAKPTIEQLAADYRKKLDFAKRKQKEADDAKTAADAALVELERAGEVLGLLIGIANPCPELVITDWRNLLVGDIVEIVGSENERWLRFKGVELFVTRTGAAERGLVFRNRDGDEWCHGGNTNWRFIRRP